jgi:hypothetical protein
VPAAVALETLKLYDELDILAQVRRVGPRLQAGIRSFADHPLIGEARGIGLIGAVEIVRDKATKQSFDPKAAVAPFLVRRAQHHGLILRSMPGDIVAFCPPLIIGEAEIDEMMAGFEKALDDTWAMVREKGSRDNRRMASQYLVEIFIPLFDRKGKRFPKRLHKAVREELVAQFGGITAHVRAPAEGRWKPSDRSPTERDLIFIYEVMTIRLDAVMVVQLPQATRAGLSPAGARHPGAPDPSSLAGMESAVRACELRFKGRAQRACSPAPSLRRHGRSRAGPEWIICRKPSAAASEACRRASAVTLARVDPRAALAPLSHMLRNGFFLVHGLRNRTSSARRHSRR